MLNFEKGITAVVGPNGSGKSNISDAIRWVLGEQSVKTLRCSRMEDVIFGGTPGRRAQGYAQVVLNIENKDRALAFDSDIVSITRRYYRSGDSEYLINGASVRLRDINELFMDTGLGRDGYSMIGQGKIDSIVSAHSQERREIFEEAAGISRFRYRKEESERRLQKAEENLLRLEDIASELESRVGPLQEQSKKAEEFLALSDEKRTLEIGVWLSTLNQSGRVLREQTDRITAIQMDYEAAQKEVESMAAAQEECYRQMNQCTSLAEQYRQKAAEAEEDATRSQATVHVWQNDIAHNEENIARMDADIRQAMFHRDDIEKEIAAKLESVEEKTRRLEEERTLQSNLYAELEEIRRHMDESSAQNLDLTRAISDLRVACEEERTRQASAESAIREIQERHGSTKEAVRVRRERAKELEEEYRDHCQMIKDTRDHIQALQNAVDGYELRIASRREKAEAAKKEADQFSLDVQAMERRVRMLEDMEKNLEGLNQSVKGILREAQRGTLTGIHGTVSQLVHVQKVYAAALETALGPALQNIVTENEQDAKRAIYFLKQKNAGRATFLPLSTIHGNELHEPGLEECPGFIGIASVLCDCDPMYKEVLRSLLGRVAVAEDLDSATAIARRFRYRFRIVTLDGQVINTGGSMTGGSMVRSAGLLSRRSEIEQAEKQVHTLKAKADLAAARAAECQKSFAQAEADLLSAKSEYNMAREELLLIEGEQKRNQTESESIQQQIQELEQEQLSGDSRIRMLEEQKEEAQARLLSLTEKMNQHQDKLQSLTKSRDALSLSGEELNAKLQNSRMTIFTIEKDRETCREEVQRNRELLKDQAQRRSDLEKDKLACEKQIQELREKIDAMHHHVEDLRAAAEKSREDAQHSLEERSAVEQKAAQLRVQERAINEKKESIGHELTKLTERKETLQKQYDDIIKKLWDEYELTRREAEQMDIHIEDPNAAQKRLQLLRSKIRALGTVNVAAIEEYKEVSERYHFLTEQMDDIRRSREELLHLIRDLTGKMKEIFVQQFAQIRRNFSEIFQSLFGGGSAELFLSDPENVLECGIEITAQPPGKIVAHIESLSGGEKALTAICIYFAIMKVNPPPFCMLDEIEAALDDVNVDRFAAYLRRMADRTQFIVVTHRRGTMEEADTLYGVTMQDEGISKLLQLQLHDADRYISNP